MKDTGQLGIASNEAPAPSGGRREQHPRRGGQPHASMRPPRQAGEMIDRSSLRAPGRPRFNEAPASSGGNGRAAWPCRCRSGCFNEAPASSGGNAAASGSRAKRTNCFNEAPASSGGNARTLITRSVALPSASLRAAQHSKEGRRSSTAARAPAECPNPLFLKDLSEARALARSCGAK